MRIPLTTAALAVLALSTPALADVHLSYVDDTGAPATQLYVKDGSVRLETGADVMLYDTKAGRFTMIDTGERSYTVMDAETMEKMAARAGQARQQMAGRMAQMQEQMAGMPPEQRAMMEQMMGGLAANAADPAAMAAPEVEIRDMGGTRKVAGFACKDVQAVVNGAPVARMCVAGLETLGIPAADRATLDAMHAGMERMAAAAPGGAAMPDIMPQGLALRYEPVGVAAEDGEGPEMLGSIDRGAVRADLFRVPAGYAEQEMPGDGFE